MDSEIIRGSKSVPAIVRIVITQATRRRVEGSLTDADFEEQLRRITGEELDPKALILMVRNLSAGRTRFLIKEKDTGTVCEMMDFASDGTLQSENAAATPQDLEGAPVRSA